MTQDPYGQPPGTGYAARGEVVPDDEADAIPPTTPMTQFQRVASALRGDRTDPAMPALSEAGPEEAGPEEAGREEAAAGEPAAAGAEPAAAGGEPAAAGADMVAQDPATTQPDLYGDTASAATAAGGASEPEMVGKHAGAPAQEGGRPGESDHGLGDFSDLTYGSLLPDAAEFKAQWRRVQFRFVDDPPGSVTEAADVVAQVTAKLEAAIAERQRAIAQRQRALRARWSEGQSADTESLRETLLMYRAFLDQLTGPKDG